MRPFLFRNSVAETYGWQAVLFTTLKSHMANLINHVKIIFARPVTVKSVWHVPWNIATYRKFRNSFENISKVEANGNTLITALKLSNQVLAEDEISILVGV